MTDETYALARFMHQGDLLDHQRIVVCPKQATCAFARPSCPANTAQDMSQAELGRSGQAIIQGSLL